MKELKGKSFDLVYSRNSLDHTISAKKTFENMTKLLKKRGFISIEFMKHEGSHTKWVGLHGHNPSVQGKNLVHIGRDSSKTILNKNFNLIFTKKDIKGNKVGNWQSIIFQKV